MAYRLLASTGAFIGRANGRNFYLIEKLAPKIDCDGLELMFYEDWYNREDELCAFLNGLKAGIVTFHADKQIGELLARENFSEAFSRFETNCRIAKNIGAGLIVLHLWNGPTSDKNIGANLSAFPKIKSIAEDFGVTVTVENVIASCFSPIRHWHELLKISPDAALTYDTKMAQFDFENEKAFSNENLPLWKNIRHIHLNDRTGGYRDWSNYRALNLGKGDVDFEAFFEGLKRVGYQGDFTVEASAFTSDGLDIDGLNMSLKTARNLIEGLKKQNKTVKGE